MHTGKMHASAHLRSEGRPRRPRRTRRRRTRRSPTSNTCSPSSASVRSDDRQVKVLCSLTSSLVSAPPLFLLSVLTALFFLLPYFSSALCSHLSLSSSPSHLLASHSIPPCRATLRCTWPRRPRPPSRSGWPTASRPRRWSGGCSSPGAAAGSVQPPRRRCSSAVSRTPHLAPVGVSIGERRWCR